MKCCILFQEKLENAFWAEAVNTTGYLRNRCAYKSINGRTPYEEWRGNAPRISHLRTIGTEAYVLNKTQGREKFDARGEKGVLVGYSEQTKGYRVWIPERKKVVISRDVRFLEEISNSNEEQKFNELPIEEHNEDIESRSKSEDEPKASEINIHSTPERNIKEKQYRGAGRPRIIRTGSRGRPRKQYHMRSTSNTTVHDQGENRDNTSMETDEEDDNRTEYQDQEEKDDVFHEVNITQLFMNTTEVQMEEALKGEHEKEWIDAMIQEIY